jgi:outer membrane lipoprotein carrier protein
MREKFTHCVSRITHHASRLNAMRNTILWAVLGCMMFLCPNVLGQERDEIIDLVQQQYEVTDDMQAAFTQLSFIKSLGQTKESHGVVYFKKPGKMRWEYTDPDQQLLVSDGNTMWFYVADDAQVLIQDARDAYGSKTPITFLSGMGKLQNDFYINLLPPDAEKAGLVDGHRLELLPKQPQPDVAKLVLTVDPDSFQVVHTAVYDPYGNITDVYLQDMQINVELPDELFLFEIPEGVDVIRQDQ